MMYNDLAFRSFSNLQISNLDPLLYYIDILEVKTPYKLIELANMFRIILYFELLGIHCTGSFIVWTQLRFTIGAGHVCSADCILTYNHRLARLDLENL